MQTPSFVHSQVQIPITRLHWQTQIPFIVQQQLHIPSASILHRFCSVAHDTSSSHEQRSFRPPWHFSTFIVQRGTTHQLPVPGAAGAGAPIAEAPNPVAPCGALSRIALVIAKSFRCEPLAFTALVGLLAETFRVESAIGPVFRAHLWIIQSATRSS